MEIYVGLDVSLKEMETTLSALQGNLREGALILDTFPLKAPVMALVQHLGGDSAQFVGGHIVPSPRASSGTEPDAGLLDGATFYLVAPDEVTSKALDMATNLAEAVGAKPQFIDALEHDGLMASTLGLPLVTALAMVNAIGQEAGCRDRMNCVGAELANAGSPLLTVPPEIAQAVLTQIDGLLPWLDIFALELARVRELIAQKRQDELETLLEQAEETLANALSHKVRDLEHPVPADAPRNMWRDMFLGRFGQRREPR